MLLRLKENSIWVFCKPLVELYEKKTDFETAKIICRVERYEHVTLLPKSLVVYYRLLYLERSSENSTVLA